MDVLEDGDAGGFVGDVAAGDGMGLGGATVPAGEGLAVGAGEGFDAVAVEQGVAVLDVVEVADDGLGGMDGAAVAEVPLEGADPEDEFGDGGGAGVDLDAEELVGITVCAGEVEEGLAFAEGVEEVEDLALDALEVFEGDVEEVAGAAGGVEDAEVDEALVEGADGGAAAFLRSPAVAWVMAAARVVSQSSRSGSTRVGRTRRST
jgi:hypothetical protein